MLSLLGIVLKSRTGAIALALLAVATALVTWHHFDKSSAVRAAVTSLVADVELSAAEAELKALKQHNAALATANLQFQFQLTEAEALTTKQAEDLDNYVSTVNAVCVVDQSLFDRLSNR